MQKTLIIQVKVGNTPSYVYDRKQSPDALEASKLIEPILIPTVKRYCNKFNYDYKNITEYPQDLDITYFNNNMNPQDYDYSKGGKNRCSTLIRYLKMDLDYDRIVVLDNDIWIPEWAEELPEVLGHHGVVDLGKDYNTFNKKFKLNKFINGGVQMVNREAGKSLKKYIKNAIQWKLSPPGDLHTDQAYMNHWRSQNIPISYTLTHKWNFMVSCHSRTNDYRFCNFVHYAGWHGRSILLKDYKDGIIK